jgi:hypothetical protein
MSLASLCLASKIIESQKKALKTKDLKWLLKDPQHNYAHTEQLILREFNFYLNIKTPYDFLEEMLENKKILNGINRFLKNIFKKYTRKLLHIICLEYSANHFPSDIIAISIVLIAKKVFNSDSSNLINYFLKRNISEKNLISCMKFILKILKKINN